jgi:hypothetical protein
MADEDDDGKADAESHSEFERVKDCGCEDKKHETELGPSSETEEEDQVMRAFFNERVCHDGDHGAEHSFLLKNV